MPATPVRPPSDAPPGTPVNAPLDAPSSESARTRADGGRIVRASILITLAYAAFKVLSLAQMMVINAYCDTPTVNLFDFGYTHVLMLFFLIGEEAISPALLPLFINRRAQKGARAAWTLANSVVTAQALLIGGAAVLVALYPEFVVRHLTGWESPDADPVYMQYAPRYARAMAAAMVLVSLSSSTYMLLAGGHKRFFMAAFGDAMLKIGLIAVVVAGVVVGATPEPAGDGGAARLRLAGEAALYTFGIGAFVGGLLKVGTHLAGLGRERRFLGPAFAWRSPDFRRFLWLLLPLLAGILFAKFRDLYNNLYIVSHIRDAVAEGGVAGGALMKANQNGVRLFRSLAQIVPMAVSVAMLPFLCEMVDRDRREQLGRTVTACARLMLLLFVPMAALMAPLSRPLVRVVLFRGQFTELDAELTAISNIGYSFVLPFVALEPVLMNVYFSQRRMVLISVLGIVFSALTVLTNAAGVFWFGLEGRQVLWLLALSFTGWRMAKVVCFALVMRRNVPACFPLRETASFLVRLVALSAAAGLAAWGARLGMAAVVDRIDALRVGYAADGLRGTAIEGLAFLAVPGSAGVGVAGLGAWILLRGDVRLLIGWVRERLRRRRGGKGTPPPPPPPTSPTPDRATA